GYWCRVALTAPRRRLHAGGDDPVSFARADRVHRHAGGLQTGRAVAGDRAPGKVVVPQLHGNSTTHVEPGLAAGEATPEHQVVDLGGIEFGDLVECGADHLGGQIIGTHVDQ